MLECLKDWLGVNKYVLVWDFVTKNGSHLKGRDCHVGNKWFAQRMAAGMNRDYGRGTHWVERA